MKKIATLSVILLMLVVTLPNNITAYENDKNTFKIVDKNNVISSQYNNFDSINYTYIPTDKIFGKEWIVGFVKVNSTGKGGHLIWPLKILKLDLPIPTIQYQEPWDFRR